MTFSSVAFTGGCGPAVAGKFIDLGPAAPAQHRQPTLQNVWEADA